ncbi:hypothetical protein C9374_000848 [Naegleria lovaniensis]|uniref:DUF1264-domain-containing protein n=1 Tax=Naegleria lovaniensis TaxID=51637 RepID=A0AA88KMW4_NAELO|nr:uncharacterized protein C9374_000848 [Naegleria lovaniensis]KAG2387998.1 hypothetical protein C9374_000848 [Naegleria lovaniensis]
MNRVVTAHHYCSHPNEQICQCVIYDNDTKDARLIGIEYIISEELYNKLDPEEQKLWHSHVYEVKGGLITCPHIPTMAEHEVMKFLIKSYGKTIHTWQVDQGHDIPIGLPNVMMAFTYEDPSFQKAIKDRDVKYSLDRQAVIKNRADIKEPVIHPNADSWSKGNKKLHLVLSETKDVSESTNGSIGYVVKPSSQSPSVSTNMTGTASTCVSLDDSKASSQQHLSPSSASDREVENETLTEPNE